MHSQEGINLGMGMGIGMSPLSAVQAIAVHEEAERNEKGTGFKAVAKITGLRFGTY